MWLDHLSLVLDIFIKSSDELKEHNKLAAAADPALKATLEKIPEESALAINEDEDEELAPLGVSRSVSLPLSSQQKATP